LADKNSTSANKMDVFRLIRAAAQNSATDLQLVVGSAPLVRISGVLEAMAGESVLTPDEVDAAFGQLATGAEREAFDKEWELDFGYSVPGVGRLRCNAALQLNGITLSIRLLPPRIPTIESLALPAVYKEFVREPRGLVVVSGPSDSGKSTTLAAMIQELNTTGGHHIVTIEDPIEYIHSGIKSAITQRQLGRHTHTFGVALRHLLRQNPSVIMVGEMRDLETADAVVVAAETGHLVLSTGHAPSAPQAIERIVDMFPHSEHELALAHLASVLVAVACQTLVPRADGAGRIAAVEIMRANAAVKNLIREGRIPQLASAIRTHHDVGMISLDESLLDLYWKGTITYETVLAFCHDRDEVGRLAGNRK